MRDDKIELTREELEAIKDDVKFRENISLRLKIIEQKITKLNNISALQGWIKAHTWAIGLIYTLLGILTILVFKGK
ncbi:hypothetical protein J7K25_00830 [bacterium]|nr:hypothetical protein [bacterium]